MLSQYSWWDFVKVVGTGVVLYYAYVAWAYYWEDIREWFSNRGQPAPATTEPLVADDDPQPGSIFMVKDYSTPASSPTGTAAPIPAPPIPAPAPAPPTLAPVANTQPLPGPKPVVEDQATEDQTTGEEVDLAGPAVSEQPTDVFGLSVADEPQSLAEQSIDDIISAAGRLEADEQGMLSPVDADDKPAARVAAVINNQQGKSVFADFSFTR